MRLIFKYRLLILIIGFQLISAKFVSGQSAYRSEIEMRTNAAKYFANDEFRLAFPLYSQLLSLDPKNPELNYRFGVCLMYTDRGKTEEPINYLEKAINKVADVDLYYHLAVAYHNNYFFTDAIYNYRKYLQLAKNKARKDYDVSRKIAMCQNGIEMLAAVDDLYVIEKTEVDRKAFYRSYNLMDYGGRILNLPKEFLNKADLKNQDDNVAYFNPKAKLLFYAINNKNQKDIYYRIQEQDKEWSPAIALSSTINTEYDEDYPIFMPDGKTLYFSSKGHNTMGGYDIFQSIFDSISGQWSEPVNLSFPFNTPSDDILFISDPDETIAWFASDRNSVADKISVYKVGIIKKGKQTENLSNVYGKDNLSGNDLGKIKNMALLDINISDKDFREIPLDRSRKLDALKKNDASRISQNIHQANLINVDRQIAVQEIQTDLADSIKTVIFKVESKLEFLKSLYLQTQNLVSSKAAMVKQGYNDLKLVLEKAQNAAQINLKKEAIKEANLSLFKTLKLNYQYEKLDNIENNINDQINAQRELLSNSTALFGDIQKNIVTQNDRETRLNINRLDKLIVQADTLTDYTKIVDYSRGEFYNLKYPQNLSNENAFAVYYLANESKDAPILAIESRFAGYIPETNKLVVVGNEFQNKQVTPNQEVKSTQVFSSNNNTSAQIREELSNLNKIQTERLDWLKQQSALLTTKASDKLEASNKVLLDFESAREQYNKGLINDKNIVIDKQNESQTLLYQSLAIINFAEKTDSLFQAEQKRKEESVNKIFAIEQALQSNQNDKAALLLIELENFLNDTIYNEKSLVQNWIESSINNIPTQKKLANQAFENSQKLTDESMQLITEVQDLNETASSKSNAFKRRQITIKAEKKEALAIKIQENADKQLAIATKLQEEINKAEAIQKIADEFSSSVFLAQNNKLIVNPEKRKAELGERMKTREKGTSLPLNSNDNTLAQNIDPIFNIGKIPKMNDLIAYSTKHFIGQLLAEELDINKRETVHLLESGKKLKGIAYAENNQKIENLRKEADSLQKESTQAFLEAGKIYEQLPAKDKIIVDKSKNDFEDYLKNIRDRIAQLLNEVTILSEQSGYAKDEVSRGNLKRQADDKEQVAMYLILEEFEIIARRNHQNYRKNLLAIDKLALETRTQQEKELMQTIFNQIENLIKLANAKRIEAKGEKLSFTLTKALLQDAFSYESRALDLQANAIRMMQENDINSMLAYQSQIKIDNKPIQPATNTTEIKEVKNTLAENQVQNTQTNPNIAVKEKENSILSKPDIKTPEKQIIKPEIKESAPSVFANSPDYSNRANSISKIFPNVNLSEEPKGNQYSVQIAAIGALKTTNNFMNVAELFAIKDSEKELYRYFSGNFTVLKSAIIRRNSLRQQGYTDAFIKSWKNGKIVNLFEAAGNIDESTLALLNESSLSIPAKYRNINFSATNISQLTGVYYSVQVGVYSQPRSSANLFGISPLYHNRLKNGNWAYFNGIFKTILDAEKNKADVRNKGVSDAFVVAFKEGEKVSLVNASRSLRQGGSYPKDEDIIILRDAAIEVDSKLKSIIGQFQSELRNRTYKVQIGVFSKATSFDWVTASLGNTKNNKVDYFINNTGKYVYTIGSFGTYAEAVSFNNEQVKKIVKDAFIVTFENGKKVNVSK